GGTGDRARDGGGARQPDSAGQRRLVRERAPPVAADEYFTLRRGRIHAPPGCEFFAMRRSGGERSAMIDASVYATDEIAARFAEIHPPLTGTAALAEANRCLYCFDAPCSYACPTHIDVPRFIKKIATG